MQKKTFIRVVKIFLLLCFTYYMLVDDKLSKQSEDHLRNVEPTQNLQNNIFIRLAAPSNDKYEESKQQYIALSEKAKQSPLDFANLFSLPSPFINEKEPDPDLYCSFSDDRCLESITKNGKFLFELLEKPMSDAQNLILNQSRFNFKPIDPVIANIDNDAYRGLDYLIRLQIFKHLLEGEIDQAETLLLKYFVFSRKVAEGSLDPVTSIIFVVSVKDYFQPLIEKLISTGHVFDSNAVDIFDEFSMSEISFKKTVSGEFAVAHRYIDNYAVNIMEATSIIDRFIVYIGFRRIETLNKLADYWTHSIIPDTTRKQNFFAVKRAITANQPELPAQFSTISLLKNPRNFIGNLVFFAIQDPHALQKSEAFASADLNLMLFKLALEGQRAPIAKLIKELRFVDPYTGNSPYLQESKVCYPAWIELNSKSEPMCIQLPNLNS